MLEFKIGPVEFKAGPVEKQDTEMQEQKGAPARSPERRGGQKLEEGRA